MQSRTPCGMTNRLKGQNYGGECAARRGAERAMERKPKRAACPPKGNQLPFVTAIVASNAGDFG
jgi:hypothetical protein